MSFNTNPLPIPILPTATFTRRKEPLSEEDSENTKKIKQETKLIKKASKEVCEMETISKLA